MQSKDESLELLSQYIKNESLLNHCKMVATAMESYAKSLNLTDTQVFDWWCAGLLHDIDWEMYPNEHPNIATSQILPEHGFPIDVIEAIKAHAPFRTGKVAETLIERYLFACDELCGFLNAASLIRPGKFQDMEVRSILKKLKDKRFAENVSREDIYKGAELIEKPLEEHIEFLIKVFK